MALNEDKIIINVVAQVDDSELNSGLKDIKKEVDTINKSDDLDIKIKATVDNVNSATSLKDLKSSLKELQGLALEVGDNNQEALNKINIAAGQAKDKIGDLKDGFSSLSGSPIENVATSFSSLKQKITSLDLEGVKQQFGNLKLSLGQVAKGLFSSGEAVGGVSKMFGGLKTAIAATGLGILLIVVGAVIANFDNLKGSGGLLGKVFTALGDVVSYVTGLFTKFTDAIGLTDIASQKLAETTAKNNKKINDSYQESLDFQVAYLKARGLNSEEAERKAQSQREQSARQNIIDLKAQGKLQGEEAEKAFSELRKQKEASIILDATLDKKALDDAKDASKKKLEALKKSGEATKKELEKQRQERIDIQNTKDKIDLIKAKDKDIEELNQLGRKSVEVINKLEELDKKKIDKNSKQYLELELQLTQYYARIDEIEKDGLDESKKNDDAKTEAIKKNLLSVEEANNAKNKKIREKDDEANKHIIENQESRNRELQAKEEEHQKFIRDGLDMSVNYVIDKFSIISEKVGGVSGAILEGVSGILSSVDESFQNFGQRTQDFFDAFAGKISETGAKVFAGIEAGLGAASELVDTIGAALQKTTDENIAANDRETKKRLKNLDQRAKTEKLTENQIAQAKYAIQVDAYNKDLALRKKAFQQQKAIQIVQAVIGTAQGIVSALANPFPLSIVMAALAGVVGAVNIGLIAAQKFPEGDGPPSAPTPTPIPTPTEVNQKADNATPANTPDSKFIAPQFFGLGGKQSTDNGDTYQKVYVVESDITTVQKRVNVIEDRARIG